MRTIITNKIKEAFSDYEFHQGFIAHINSYPYTLPLVWLNPPKMTDLKGRREGEREYYVSLYMMCNIVDADSKKSLTEAEKDIAWEAMEEDAISAIRRLRASEGVISVGSVRTSPDELAVSRTGDLSLLVEFSVRMPWCDGSGT